MPDCIFCDIVEKNIPHHEIIWSDSDHIAFLSINPSKEGHTLVIPKVHADNVMALTQEDYSKLMEAARIVSILLKEHLKCDVVAMVSEGFSVAHAHIHIIPLHTGEKLTTFTNIKVGPWDLAETAKKIRGEA